MLDLHLENWPIDRLREYPRNPRINDHAVEPVAKMISEFGFRVPMLVRSDGEIVDGHLRLKAARHLGLATVPVILCDDLSVDQIAALRISVNQASNLAEWDLPALNAELIELDASGFDMPLLGFSDGDLKQMMANPGGRDPDEMQPEPPAQPVTRYGDLWILGEHRLLCGDATSADDVANLLRGAKPHLMVTDPPYGVEYDPDWRNRADRANGKSYGDRAVGIVVNDAKNDWAGAWRLFSGDIVYCWHAGRHASVVQYSLSQCGFDVISQIIWAKTRLIISRGDYHWQHEPCWYAVRKGASHRWAGDRSQTTLWTIEHQKSETGHSTQKPVECMRRPIENNSEPGNGVYDPFSGSGTTIIAAELTARKCFAMEIYPGYCDVSVRRWEKISGKRAELIGRPGWSIDDIAEERGVPQRESAPDGQAEAPPVSC